MRGLWAVLAGAVVCAPAIWGQEIYAAKGPGSYVTVGGTVGGLRSDYGRQTLGGGTVFLDANLFRRVGVEAEVRTGRYHSTDSLRETTYLVGPKISSHGRGVRPYAKLLAGPGTFNFPHSFAQGRYFVLSPGFGVDWRVGQSRLFVRLLDVEYQYWGGFTYGALRPAALSSGVSFRVY